MIGALGLTIFASSASGSSSGTDKTTASLPSFKAGNLVPGLTAFTSAAALEANLGSHTGGVPVLGSAVSSLTVTSGTVSGFTTGLLGTGSLTWSNGGVGSYLWAEGTFGLTITTTDVTAPTVSGPFLSTTTTKIASASKAGLAAGFTAKKAGLFNSCLVVDFATSKIGSALKSPSKNFKAAIVPMGSGWKATSTVPPTPRRYVGFNSLHMYNHRPDKAAASDLHVTPFALPVSPITSTMFAYCGWTYLNAGEQLAFAVQPATAAAVGSINSLTGTATKDAIVSKTVFQFQVGIGGMYDPSWNYSNFYRNLSKPFVAVPVKSNKFDLNNIHDWAYEGTAVNASTVCNIVSNNSVGQVTRGNVTACLVISSGAFLGDLVAAGPKFDQSSDLIAVIVPGRALSDEVGYGRYAADQAISAITDSWLNGFVYSAIPAIGQTTDRQDGLTSGGILLTAPGQTAATGTKSVVIAYIAKGNDPTAVVMERPRNSTKGQAVTFLLQGSEPTGSKPSLAGKAPCALFVNYESSTLAFDSPYTDTYYLTYDLYGASDSFFFTPNTVVTASSTTMLKDGACMIGAHGVGRKAGNLSFKLTINTAISDSSEITVTAMRYLVTETEADLTQTDSFYYGRDTTTAQSILKLAQDVTTSANVSHQTINGKSTEGQSFTFNVPVGMGASKGFHDIAALQIACTKASSSGSDTCTSANLSLETTFKPYEALDAGLSTTNDTSVNTLLAISKDLNSDGILPVHLTAKTQAAAFTSNAAASLETGKLTLPKGVNVNIPLATGQLIAYMPTAAPTAGYSKLDSNPFGTYGVVEKNGSPPIRYIVPYLQADVTKDVSFEVSALDLSTMKFNSNLSVTQNITPSDNKSIYALKKQPILAYDRYDSAGMDATALGDTAVLTLRMTADDTAEVTGLGVGYAVAGADASTSARVIVVVAAFVSALIAMLIA